MSTLSERIAANRCKVVDCDRARAVDSQVCRADLPELWHNRLARQDDGTYLRRRALPPRDLTWADAA